MLAVSFLYYTHSSLTGVWPAHLKVHVSTQPESVYVTHTLEVIVCLFVSFFPAIVIQVSWKPSFKVQIPLILLLLFLLLLLLLLLISCSPLRRNG